MSDLRDLLGQVTEHFEQENPGEFDPGSVGPGSGTEASAPSSPSPASPSDSKPAPAMSTPTPGRDASGKFTSQQNQTPPITPAPKPGETVDSNVQPTPGQQLGAQKYPNAPGTWKPEAREHWNNIPEQIREEIHRREKDATRALNDSTSARKFSQEFERTIQPYLGFIAAENSTPLQAVSNMMQTAAVLRVGTAQQKVDAIAHIIRAFGVDLEMLDGTLAGQGGKPDMQLQLQQMIQQQLAPFQQFMQNQQQQYQLHDQNLESEVDSELQNFEQERNQDGSLKYEFFNDVRQDMADIIELAQRRGVQMSLTEAYQRATLVSEPVRRVIEQRQQRQAAQQAQRVATNARRNAMSIPGSPETTATNPVPGDSIRSAIEFAMSNTQGS